MQKLFEVDAFGRPLALAQCEAKLSQALERLMQFEDAAACAVNSHHVDDLDHLRDVLNQRIDWIKYP